MLVSSNMGTSDLVTWPSKWKLVESMEYTNGWYIQQGISHWRFHKPTETNSCVIQETKLWYGNYKIKIQCRIFQSSSKFLHIKNKKTNLVHLYINLVEAFPLILNLKIVFKCLLWLKLSILKNTLHTLNLILSHTKKQAYF